MPTCCGLGAIHGDVQLRLVVGLLNVHVGRAGNGLQLRQQLARQIVILSHVGAGQLHVDGRRAIRN